MTIALQDIAWHRSVAQLIDALDRPNFWAQLVRLLDQYVSFDSWVALQFSSGQRPQVFAEIPRRRRQPGSVVSGLSQGAVSARPLLYPQPRALAERSVPTGRGRTRALRTDRVLPALLSPECRGR